MGKRRVTIDGLADAINGILEEYENDVEAAMEPVLKKTAQTARAEVRANSPKNTGDYAKGWQYKREKTRHGTRYTIYNGTKPGLTYLLENGHALRNGGRAPAHPHIAKVEEQIKEKLPGKILEALEKM